MKVGFLFFVFCLICSMSFSAMAETSQEVGTFESTVDEVLRSKDIQPRNIVYNFSVRSSTGSISPEEGDNMAHFTTFTPQLGLDLKSASISSAYFAAPLYWNTFSDSSSSRILGRPELGVSKTMVENAKWGFTAELGFNFKLPIYEDTSGHYVDANRVYQFAPSLTTNQRLSHSRFHFITASRMSYDTKASVALPGDSNNGVKGTGLERPLAMRLSAALEFDQRFFTIGWGLKTVNWLGSGKVTGGDSVLREVSPVDLMLTELTGSFQIQPETKLNLTVAQGLKTHTDLYAFVQQDAPEEIASSTLSLGITKNF